MGSPLQRSPVMTTKAEAFRTQQQRAANPPRVKQVKSQRNSPVDTSLPGVSASDRKAGGGSSGTRNESVRAGKKAGDALEDSATGKPSRRSTRKSVGRVNRTGNLRRQATRKASAPKTVASKAAARR